MNHPCKDWYDTKKRELKKDKQTDSILDKNIRFRGLSNGDERDFEMCFRWEYDRTRKFLGKKSKMRVFLNSFLTI